MNVLTTQPLESYPFQPTPQPAAPAPERRALGEILLERGAVSPENLTKALVIQKRRDLRLGDILLAHGWVTDRDLVSALAVQYGTFPIDLKQRPPEVQLIEEIGARTCLAGGFVPVIRFGGATVVATSQPDRIEDNTITFPESFGQVILAFATVQDIHTAIQACRSRHLIDAAETRVQEVESCRFWYGQRPRRILAALCAVLVTICFLAPIATLSALMAWSFVTLTMVTGLKLLATFAPNALWKGQVPQIPDDIVALSDRRLPVVSVMVPLFKESDIAPRLVARLGRQTYPKELLDICIITEEADTITREMLAQSDLPYWMRVITVPDGSLKTKPRALNFAMDFCRGDIIGVWDAEDAPDPEQIHKVVRRFNAAPTEVACLQGALDYYNSTTNWFSRCFTIEYAAWFRVVLSGIQQLGLVIPLGGTTLFFRRAVIEELGGWDAHNVTEDADLGVRLYRRGYRTEILRTVTEEEANARLWPWVKQRSRWVKGYMITWSVHMRDPARLWRELGPKRFMGFQIMFLCSLSQFLLVPLMWSFWAIPLGLPHPLHGVIPWWAMVLAGSLFLICETLNICVGFVGLQRAGKIRLWPWVPTLYFYYPLASLAAYKALYEMVVKPFYWDKTAHGVDDHHENERNP